MTISVGDTLPDVKLVKATAQGPEAVQSAEFFKGKRVALFAVPGAFTPTCSAHLPGFVEKADAIKAKGIDEIACISVNDAFVMKAWGAANGADTVTMLADGNGDFAKAVGLTMDGSGFGLACAASVCDGGEGRRGRAASRRSARRFQGQLGRIPARTALITS
jgi:peroxiredoxin